MYNLQLAFNSDPFEQQIQNPNHRSRRHTPSMSLPSESEFSSTITRIAVSQICRSFGYTAAQTSALNTFTDIAARYLRALADSAAASANSGGRTQSNIFDTIIALEDLGSVQGFTGAPKVASHSMISSPVLKEIMKFLFYSDEIPFSQPIPRRILPEVRKSGNGMNLRHVPRWLPAMPVVNANGNGEENLGWGIVGEGSVQSSRMEKDGKRNGKGFELPVKRGKVSFRMGMGMGMGRGRGVLGSGVGNRGFGMEMGNGGIFSRGGGIGKRILCQSWSDSDGNEERKRAVKK